MYPVFSLFGLNIPAYLVMAILGGFAYAAMLFVTVRREKLSKETSITLFLISAAGGAVLYVSALLFNSLFHSIEQKKLVIGGITWLGGIVGVYPFLLLMMKLFVKGRRPLEALSLLLPGVALGHVFGRIGCFLGGCCFGKVDEVLGVVFPAGSRAAAMYPAADGRSLPVLPTQLFEAAFELLFFAIMFLSPKRKYNASVYLIGYGTFRFLLEFLRGDDRGSTGFFLTPSQLLCVIILIAGVLLLLAQAGVFRRRKRAA